MNAKVYLKSTYIKILILIFILIQILLITFLNINQISDSAFYIDVTKKYVFNNQIYPSKSDIYSQGIFAPAYINYLILLFKLFNNNIRLVLYMNVILNLILLFEIYYIAKHFFNDKIAIVSITIYSLYISVYGSSLYVLTEPLYCVLAYGAICAFLSKNKKFSFLSGILIALANWVRPLTIPFIIAIILINLFEKRKARNLFIFILGGIMTISIIGTITYGNMGYFIFQTETPGRNLIQGANSFADGSSDNKIFEKGYPAYINPNKKLNFKQRDKIYWDRSIKWIENNPVKYIKLFPRKLFYMYAMDTQFLSVFSGKGCYYKIDRNFVSGMFHIKNYKEALKNDKNKFVLYLVVLLNQMYYVMLILLSLYGIYIMIKSRNKTILIFLSIILFGTGMTIISMGGSRYHYPYMIISIVLSAYTLEHIVMKLQSKRELTL